MLEDISILGMSASSNVSSPDETPQPPPPAMSGDKTRTKKWAPKTFNGCMTCKKRRIKCDEGKPACQRCIKSNIRCGGYAPPRIRLFDPTSSSSTSTPTTVPPDSPPKERPPDPDLEPESGPEAEPESELKLVTTHVSQSRADSGSNTHPRDLTLLPRFGTQEEYQSFQFFLEKTSDLLSVYSQPYLWSVLLPQATWHQPSMKHSIIALASLHQSLTTVGPASQRANHFFIFHYNTAIRALVADKPPVDIVLSACVIFWALENFNGSRQAAFDHMKAAIKILGEWKTKRRPNDPADNLISKYIEPTIVEGLKFASKRRIEELAGQMDTLSLTSRDARIMSLDYPAFDNLEDAETYLAECINKILNLKSQTQAHRSYTLDREALVESIEQLDAELYKWMHLFQNLTATGPVHVRRMLIVQNVAANILLDQLKEQAQYTPAEEEEQSDTDADSPERAGRCRHSFIMMEVDDVFCQDADAAMDARRNKPRTLGLIAPIFLVAISARQFKHRRRAINALRLLDITEGPWDSSHASRIAEAMLEICQQCSVLPASVQWQHMIFDLDREEEVLRMRWEPDDLESITRPIVKTVDLCGVNWNKSDILELIKRYGYQFPPIPHS